MEFNPFKLDLKNTHFEIRNPITKEHIGYKDKNTDEIYVLNNSSIEYFLEEYQALKNYNMGQAVEIIDLKTDKVDHFALFYSFKEAPSIGIYHCYRVLEEFLTNLDILEIINHYKEQNK